MKSLRLTLYLGTLLALGALGLFAGCSQEKSPPAEKAPQTERKFLVTTSQPQRRSITPLIEAVGTLVARQDVVVKPLISGRIEKLKVDEGSEVKEGEVLLRLNSLDQTLQVKKIESALGKLEAQLSQQETDLKRLETLLEKGAVDQQQVDLARVQRDVLQAEIIQAKADLGVALKAVTDTVVAAPFSGVVAERMVDDGEVIKDGNPLFRIVALDPIEAEFTLPEDQGAQVAIGQKVKIQIRPLPNETFEGIVTFISPSVDPATRTLRLKGTLPNPEGRLKPGYFAELAIELAERSNALVVPESTVQIRRDRFLLFTVENGVAKQHEVQTGQRMPGQIEITSGITGEETIVVLGAAPLFDGAKVEIKAPEAAETPEAVPQKS